MRCARKASTPNDQFARTCHSYLSFPLPRRVARLPFLTPRTLKLLSLFPYYKFRTRQLDKRLRSLGAHTTPSSRLHGFASSGLTHRLLARSFPSASLACTRSRRHDAKFETAAAAPLSLVLVLVAWRHLHMYCTYIHVANVNDPQRWPISPIPRSF